MKRKALLLIIPFAAAGLAGCEQANPPTPPPQCDPTGATINKETLTIHVGDVDDSVVANAPSGCTFSWSSSKEAVATVSAQGEITGVAVGTAVVKFADASGQGVSCTVTVVPVGQHIHTFSDEWSYDAENHWHAATCEHTDQKSELGEHIDEDEDEICDICELDLSKPVAEELSPEQVIDLCDKAGEGKVVDKEVIVVGVVAENSDFDSKYKEWKGKFEGSSLTFDGVKTEESYDTLDGKTVKIKGYPELYNGTYKVGYLPANISPTGEKYSPTLVSVSDPVQKEVSEIVSVASSPEKVTVNSTVSPSSVKLNVKYTDGSTGVVSATKVDCDTSKEADSVEATAWYNQVGSAKFNIKVVAQGQAVYGTEDNPISVSQAIATMNIDCPADTNLTKQAMYCIGTVKQIKNTYHYEGDIGSDCYELVLTDGTNDVIVYRLHSTDDLKDQVAEGNEIKICGYGKNFKGTLEFVDNGATKCILLDNGTPTPQKEVTGITGVSYTKPLYVGGTINPSDVTLTVTYSDGTSGTVKAQSVDGYSTAAVGKTTATAHYGTFTKTFEVDVSEAPSDPVVGQTFTKVNTQSDLSEGIYILGSGNYFFHGADEADKSIVVSDPGDSIVGLEGMAGLQIEEVSGGYSIKVLNGANEGKYIGPKSGADNKNIVFGSDPVTHTISVAEGVSTLTSGEKLLKFNDQTGQNRFRYYTSGQKDVVLYKQGTPVPQKTITGVELQGTLAKSSYVAGQTFDPSGLSLKVTYNEGDPDVLTSGFTFNVTNPLEVGEYDLKATYQGHTTEGSVHISVVAKAITALEIKSGMTKTAYVLEEAWAPAGIVVEATYNDGSKANLQSDDYTLEFDPTEPALETEEVSIVAKVANGTTSAAYTQKVSVTEEKVEATLTDIAASGYTNTATVGQTYTFDGTVTASYSDGSSHAVTGYSWTTPINTETDGEKTGVISYTEGDVTKTCNVIVTVAAHENTVKAAYEAAIPMTGSDDETGEMTFEGVVSAIQGNSFVVADGDYGILVYNYAVSGIDVGKTITVKATLKNYKGLIETSSTKSATLGAAGTVPTPVNVTSVTQLNGLKTNVLVNCAQLEVVSKETAWASNKTSNWVVKLNGSNVTLSLNQYAFDSAKSLFIKGLNVGDVFSASSLTVGCYNNVNQLSVMRDTTFQAAPAKEIASLGDVTAPESIAKGGTLSVSDVSVAVTYDDATPGSVHPDRIELDTSTVADSVTGTVYVGDLSATFTIAVTEKPVSTETTITKAIKDISGTTSDGTKVSNMTMDAVISLVALDSGNNGKVYGSGAEWRLYHSDSGTMTVNAVSGYTIVSIKITYTNAKNGYLTYDSSKVSSDDVIEINATSACFIVDGGETGKTNGQVKVSSITVVYKAN